MRMAQPTQDKQRISSLTVNLNKFFKIKGEVYGIQPPSQ